MPTPKNKYDREQMRRIDAIQRQIDAIYDEAVREAAALGVTINMPQDAEKMFSFDDYPMTKKRVKEMLDNLRSQLQAAIVNGVRSSWTLANNKNNELCNVVFGNNVGKLTEEQYRRYYSTNGAALDAFIKRKENGMNLSDRVWHYSDLFKREIEMGLDLGIRSGLDAPAMARDLKQYLRHPDKLFRRVRDEHGNLQLSKAAADFHPGRGVYRSSYLNARRLAATETNIAYRTADHERWKQMDFVVGIEIHLSNNHTCKGRDGKPHPFTDICDDLKGKYPKDFKFTGWHPHCRCFATSILKTDEEIAEDTKRILRGERPTEGSENTVEDVPEGFKDWMKENEERIDRARERGTLPYFIRDNEYISTQAAKEQKVVSQPQEQQPTKRQRTQEESDDIQHRWNRRRLTRLYDEINKGNLPASVADTLKDLEDSNELYDFDDFASRARVLETAAARHASRTPEQIRLIQDKADLHTYGQEYVDNVHEIEKALGMQRGKRMTHKEANVGKVNPNYGKSRGYGNNCSTCSATYILRRMGFPVEAKANTALNKQVKELSIGMTTWDKWINGTTEYHSTHDWMVSKGVTRMDSALYQEFIDEYTKDTGIYEFNVGYFYRGGHSTLLERKPDGTLVRIEQQNTRGDTLKDLIGRLTPKPPSDIRGIMRVDNARFNAKYSSIVKKTGSGGTKR